jgi:hypothetical protein
MYTHRSLPFCTLSSYVHHPVAHAHWVGMQHTPLLLSPAEPEKPPQRAAEIMQALADQQGWQAGWAHDGRKSLYAARSLLPPGTSQASFSVQLSAGPLKGRAETWAVGRGASRRLVLLVVLLHAWLVHLHSGTPCWQDWQSGSTLHRQGSRSGALCVRHAPATACAACTMHQSSHTKRATPYKPAPRHACMPLTSMAQPHSPSQANPY